MKRKAYRATQWAVRVDYPGEPTMMVTHAGGGLPMKRETANALATKGWVACTWGRDNCRVVRVRITEQPRARKGGKR